MNKGEAYRQVAQAHEAAYQRRRERSARTNACCMECGKRGNAFLHYKLDPRSLRQEWKRLCNRCAGPGWFRDTIRQYAA